MRAHNQGGGPDEPVQCEWPLRPLRRRLPVQPRLPLRRLNQSHSRHTMPARPATLTSPSADDGGGGTSAVSPAVLRILVENHARFLAFLERRVGSRDAAQEILQEAFVRSLSRGGSLRDDESAVAWFYRLLRNA